MRRNNKIIFFIRFFMIYTKVYQREGDVNIEMNNAEHP